MSIKPFQLERYFAKYEFSTRHLLCASDCESVAVQDLLDLEPDAEERLHSLWLGYTESSGSPALRQAISRIYSGISPEQVLVHSGAEEAIFTFIMLSYSFPTDWKSTSIFGYSASNAAVISSRTPWTIWD